MIITSLLSKKITLSLGIILALIIAAVLFGVYYPEAATSLKNNTWDFISELPQNSFAWMQNLLASIF